MIATTKDSIYDELVRITHSYLGPAADRFVERQIRNHLSKDPEQVHNHELASLIDWFSIAMAVLSEDENVVQRYTTELKGLIGG